ncbi:hypothetical protein FRB94_000052 [Tulasnella sp. JGI-2019a]|nr:hypothetical protein FRB94_000052 [Tulasnella sp. JGI-2019a]KAG9015739.1 hypothetical protein FRB93_012303 [Tulasnella sp. JGI-2019a]
MLPKTALSIEPIYKDDQGHPLPKVKEIKKDITHTYESPFNSATKTRKNLQRIQNVYGELRNLQVSSLYEAAPVAPAEVKETTAEDVPTAGDTDTKPFTPQDLEDLRLSIGEKLQWAEGEIGTILSLLQFLFTTPDPTYVPHPEVIPPGFLSTTDVVPFSSSLPASLPSVQALNSQLIIGTKDQTLRRASNIFQEAAIRAEKIVEQNTRYWETAVELRRSNWPLVAAPLRDHSNMVGHRGAFIGEAYTRDFRVSYGLESATPKIRRLATAIVKNQKEKEKNSAQAREVLKINGPVKRLRVGLTTTSEDGTKHAGYSKIPKRHSGSKVLSEIDEELAWAQAASVEDEIYAEVLKEVAHLPSASARISDKMMSIDAAVDAVLTLEMVDTDEADILPPPEPVSAAASRNGAIAGLILNTFSILLVRSHRVLHKAQSLRSDSTGMVAHYGPQLAAYMTMRPILAPVVSLLQYDSLITRMRRTLNNLSSELNKAGIPCEAQLRAVGDDVREVLVRGALMSEFDVDGQAIPLLSDSIPTLEGSIAALTSEREELLRVSGEASLKIGGRHMVRFTLISPASLTLHLPHATIDIFDVDEFHQFLIAEVSRCVLERLKEVGMGAESASANESAVASTRWFVDGLEGTLVGDHVGGRIQMKVMFDDEFRISAVAIKTTTNIIDGRLAGPTVHRYPPQPLGDGAEVHISLEDWVKGII